MQEGKRIYKYIYTAARIGVLEMRTKNLSWQGTEQQCKETQVE